MWGKGAGGGARKRGKKKREGRGSERKQGQWGGEAVSEENGEK